MPAVSLTELGKSPPEKSEGISAKAVMFGIHLLSTARTKQEQICHHFLQMLIYLIELARVQSFTHLGLEVCRRKGTAPYQLLV